MRNSFLTLSFLLFFQLVYSQELFTVLITSKSSKSNDSLLVIGSRINKNDKITLVPGAYLGLIHVSGKTIELGKPGIYKIDSLSNTLQPNVDYVHPVYISISKFVKPYVFDQRYKMAPTGSVERGGIFRLRAASRSYIYPDSILLQWCPLYSAKGYEVKLINMYDEDLYHVLTGKEEVVLYLDKIDFKNLEENSVKISLAAQNDPRLVTNDSYFLTILSEEKNVALEQRIREFKLLNPNPSGLNYFTLGLLFEKDDLWLNAFTQYQHVKDVNEAYTTRYKLFLQITGFDFECH